MAHSSEHTVTVNDNNCSGSFSKIEIFLFFNNSKCDVEVFLTFHQHVFLDCDVDTSLCAITVSSKKHQLLIYQRLIVQIDSYRWVKGISDKCYKKSLNSPVLSLVFISRIIMSSRMTFSAVVTMIHTMKGESASSIEAVLGTEKVASACKV